MKNHINFFGFMVCGALIITLTAATFQEKANKGNSAKQQQKEKAQGRQDKGTQQGQGKAKQAHASHNKADVGNDKRGHSNMGKAEAKGLGEGKQQGKDNGNGNGNAGKGRGFNEHHNGIGKSGGYVWNRESFKERGKIRKQDKVTICHKFNSNEPAVTIRVSSNAVQAHMNHGDVMGDCPASRDSRFSDIFLRNRTDYYNSLYYSQDQVNYSQSILDYALARLTNSRLQLANMQTNNYPLADIQRRQATVYELEENVSLLQTLVGVATNLIVNKLQQ